MQSTRVPNGVGQRLQKARASLAAAVEAARIEAIDLHALGVPETEIARTLGVNRMTVRRWLGKL
jgi:DNA invertase Pin-like site-specific DNA recombinase